MRPIVALCISLSLSCSLSSGQSLQRPVQQYNRGLANNGASVRPGILTLQYSFKEPTLAQYTAPLSAVIFSDPVPAIPVRIQQQFQPAHVQPQPIYEYHLSHQEQHRIHQAHPQIHRGPHHVQLRQPHLSQSFPYQPLKSHYTYNPPRSQPSYLPGAFQTYDQPIQDVFGHHKRQIKFSSYASY